MSATTASPIEYRGTFACFGSECSVIVADERAADAAAAVATARHRLRQWHRQFSRFEPDSEVCRLNEDPNETVAVSPLMRRIIEAGLDAARATDGLVDLTLGSEIVQAGYGSHLEQGELSIAGALALAPPRSPAGARPTAGWRSIAIDRSAGTVTRPSGVRIDVGGIAKGVFADELASLLAGHAAFAVDCAGDIRLGGKSAVSRDVHVESPFDDSILHTFTVAAGAVATSGIGRRSWVGPDGLPAHHLLDPRTGRPAFTGIVHVTALAPTASEAEVLAKAAILRGPARAGETLLHGGVVVLDDGTVQVLETA